MSPNAALTLEEVLTLAAGSGRPVTASTFRTYVAKKQAPQPASRRGRTPLWDRAEIEAWAVSEHDRVSYIHAEETLLAIQPAALSRAPISLRPTHLVQIDPALPFPEALVKAEDELENRIGHLREVSERLATVLPDRRAPVDDRRTQPQQGLIARLLQRRDSTRNYRMQMQELSEVTAEFAATSAALQDAQDDLGVVRESIFGLLSWAAAEKRRRLDLVLTAELEQERAERRLDERRGQLYCSAIEFIRDDPKRLSWVSSASGDRDKPAKSEVLEAIAGTRSDLDPRAVFLVLSGADFGYTWRQDESDTDMDYSNKPAGSWRISWIESTGDLYAQHRPGRRGWQSPTTRSINDSKVWLIGRTPRTSLRAMITWLSPLERRQSERNSLSIVFDAFDQQQSAGFPALSVHGAPEYS